MSQIVESIKRNLKRIMFRGSRDFWEARYRDGGHSGPGSSGALAEFKARVLNRFVREHRISSVVELGCGDGNQLSLAEYPLYTGLDVSSTAVGICRARFAEDETKTFELYNPESFRPEALASFDLALSLDVIFHLVEDDVFETHLNHLFALSRRFVVIYSTNFDDRDRAPHVRHRKFVPFVRERFPQWRLREHVRNELDPSDVVGVLSVPDFFVFERDSGSIGEGGSNMLQE